MNEAKASGSPGLAHTGRDVAGNAMAGAVAAIVLIANIVSFGALMFPAPLADGAATAIWAMLIGSAIVGVIVAWKTSLPPLTTGIDSPTGAVLVLVAAGAAPAVLSAGGTPQQAIAATLLLFAAASAISGALLLGLGIGRWGALLRFVPYFVVAGFMAATGWLLVAGALRMTRGHAGSDLLDAWTGAAAARLACALALFALLLALRRWVRWPYAVPATLVALTLLGTLVLRQLGLADPAQGWYLPSLGALKPWNPWPALQESPLSLPQALGFVPELMAVAVVALVSLVTKLSSLEVTRRAAADIDVELRAHGLGTLLAVPCGGIVCSMQLGTSRLLESTGGAGRLSGVACAVVLGAVGLLNLDLPALIPIPIAAGLVLQLGWVFLSEAFAKPLAQRDALNIVLALAIMAACVRWGYLAGVLGGVVCACLLFSANYARIGVVRLHLSRAQFAGSVSRSSRASAFLAEGGEAIQIYWLAGYIFFGSSEGVFERVRRDIRDLPAGRVRHVILDFGSVSAADASAPISLTKLRHHCAKSGVALLHSNTAPGLRRALEREGLFAGPDGRAPFPSATAALAWCEDALLAAAGIDCSADAVDLETWLHEQLGGAATAADLLAYLERRSFEGGAVLYRQGEPADAVDLVVAGRLAVDLAPDADPTHRVRSIATHAVVGEMGFFGRAARSATVSAEGPVTVMSLTRGHFERMRRERPDLAAAFYEFLLRTLADRIRVSERVERAVGL